MFFGPFSCSCKKLSYYLVPKTGSAFISTIGTTLVRCSVAPPPPLMDDIALLEATTNYSRVIYYATVCHVISKHSMYAQCSCMFCNAAIRRALLYWNFMYLNLTFLLNSCSTAFLPKMCLQDPLTLPDFPGISLNGQPIFPVDKSGGLGLETFTVSLFIYQTAGVVTTFQQRPIFARTSVLGTALVSFAYLKLS